MFKTDLDNLIDVMFDPFDWDKKAYKFQRDEKDMHPYSVINSKEKSIIVHNVLGIDKEDLKISRSTENGTTYILIEGKTKDNISNKEYSISSKFALDDTQLDIVKATSSMKNGLLYIIIPCKTPEQKKKETSYIEIQ